MTTLTTFDDPDRLQEAGEDCASCYLFWEVQGMEPMQMVHLSNEQDEPLTTDGGIPIVVCPYCDGGIL